MTKDCAKIYEETIKDCAIYKPFGAITQLVCRASVLDGISETVRVFGDKEEVAVCDPQILKLREKLTDEAMAGLVKSSRKRADLIPYRVKFSC